MRRAGRRQIIDGHAGMRSAFALLGSYDHMGRRFGLTTDLHVIPLDRTRRVAQSKFRGAKLGKGMTLPIAFVMRRSARRYSWHAPSRSFSIDARLPRWTTVSLTGDFRRGKNDRYLKTRAGFWVRASHVKQVRGIRRCPMGQTR